MFIRNSAISFLFLFSFQYVWAQTATIKGNVSDAISRDGLPGAYVSILKTSFKKAADDKGNFEMTHIPPGEYDLVIENVGYLSITRHVVLHAGEVYRLFVTISLDNKTLGEVTVIGEADREKENGSRDREKNAANIMNVISSQAMVRSPDINAANVLQRMSGITVQRNSGGTEAYAVIRGMEPRYNNTLVNGIKIASPDNKNRFVQLDIIPSDILSSIEISKSLTPDMESDAIGGTVNMIVKDAPQATSFKATGSIGYSQLFFDEKFYDYKKSDIQQLSPTQRNPPGYTAQPGDFSRTNLDFQPKQALPNGTIGFSYTQRFWHNKVGVVLADNLQNQYYGNISFRATVAPAVANSDSLALSDNTTFQGYTRQMNNGLVAHIDYAFNEKNRVNIDNFFIYSYLAQSRFSEDTTLQGTGRVGPGTGQIFPRSESFNQYQHIENLKISGRHGIAAGLVLDWAAVMSEAGRKLPDLADINTDYRIQANFVPTGTFFDDITRSWQKNDDKDYSGIINLDWRKKSYGGDLELKAGGLYRTKTRSNFEDDYTLRPPDTTASGGAASKPLWTNIYDVTWRVFNPTGSSVYNPNDYKADEVVYAGYVMARFKRDKWEAGGGLRVENTSTDWNITVRSPTAPSSGNQTYQDFLPSIYLKYRLGERQNLHFAYFRSINRPNYYELVPAKTPGSDAVAVGNDSLQHAVADNVDLRYELFPGGEQHFFLGAFYKRIQHAIESGLVGVSSGRPFQEPINSPYIAQNYGVEVSFTEYWGRFGVTGNYTYTYSVIHDSASSNFLHERVGFDRPLQGQTDHIVNISLLYKDTKHGAFAQLAYGYQGKTLAQVGTDYQSNYYQKPMNTLAFSAEKDFHTHFTVFGKFNNLLNTPSIQVLQQNNLQVSKDIYKASYEIGLRYSRF
jgi:outer membrane cobalamin receptor